MTSRMVGSVLTLVILLFSVVDGAAQTYTQMQWGMNKGVTPYAFGANINGSWSNLGTLSSAGVWTLSPSIISMPGTATFNGTIFSMGNGFFGNSTQPVNAYADMIAPNDTYHDNVLTIENQSKKLGTLWGNAAIRFREPTTGFLGYERAAVGYSAPTSSAYFPHVLYMEGGNLGAPGDPYDTDVAFINTHLAGATHFPNTAYFAFWMESATGILRMQNPSNGVSHEFDPVGYAATFYGAPGTGNGVQLLASTLAAAPATIKTVSNSGSSVLLRLEDGLGAGVALTSNSNYALVAQNFSASAVNYIRANGSATSAPVGLAAIGSDANILMRVEDKAGAGVALTSNGNYALLAQNSSASAVNYINATGSATGAPVALVALGTDANILFRVDDKGGAGTALASNSAYALVAQNASASAVNYLSVKGATTGNGVEVASTGSDTNIDLNLAAKGTGTVAAGSQIKLKSYTIAALPACGASNLGAVAAVSDGTAYATGTYGSAVSATGAVTRNVICTNTAGATTYAWAYN